MSGEKHEPLVADLQRLLDRERRELLDLSTRNRLLSIPVDSRSARLVHIRGELSDAVFARIVVERKAMSFAAVDGNEGARPQRPDTELDALDDDADEVQLPLLPDADLARQQSDSRLQTALGAQKLHTRLLGLHLDAQTMIEEQGVNVLYLALGQLRWCETEEPGTTYLAPLILIPVELQRKSASERFVLVRRDEDLQQNLSLAEKLRCDFGMQLPELPDDDDFNPSDYFAAVRKVIEGAAGWEVLSDAMTLGFFSFAKLLMYLDLDAAKWPDPAQLKSHPLVTALLRDGFESGEPSISEHSDIDALVPTPRLDHVVDADGSQTIAIEATRANHSLVIQGPPGTGKSQSITNIIATAVLEGKRVLFVAEKLAALEVVKRRLEREGLGDLCLELHSNKASKRKVIDEIGRTWLLGRPKGLDAEQGLRRLDETRNALSRHSAALNTSRPPGGQTLYTVIGSLSQLGERGRPGIGVTLDGAERWAPGERETRDRLAKELAARVAEVGPPHEHPWRGIRREAVLRVDLDAIEGQIRSVADRAARLREASAKLALSLGKASPQSIDDVARLLLFGRHAADAPPLDKNALCDGVWDSGIRELEELLATGRSFSATQVRFASRVDPSAWDHDFRPIRSTFAEHGSRMFRFLSGAYRRAFRELQAALPQSLPKAHTARLSLIDSIVAGQASLRSIRNGAQLGRSAFGEFWRGEQTEWDRVDAALRWLKSARAAGLQDIAQSFRAVPDLDGARRLLDDVRSLVGSVVDAWAVLERTLELDADVAVGGADISKLPFNTIESACARWCERMDLLSPWVLYRAAAVRAREAGLGGLVDLVERGVATSETVLDCFERAYWTQLLREFAAQSPEWARFDGALHSKLVDEFRTLDKERLALARYRILSAHHERMPKTASGVGAVGILRSEMERKRGHRTVRQLLRDAGSVVQAIKPVFMMSPLSVAQFLEPGAIEFDLLVIDEASQVQPVDALGAVARSKQLVVVGDSQQLPPTRFFARMTSDSSDDEDDDAEVPTGAAARDIESILGLCRARGLHSTMLRWHYRSRHHSLIAVSNLQFYENQLFIVPSPYAVSEALGLRFHHVRDGTFDAGASGTNRVEAKAVCEAVLAHARKHPRLSLGVAAFSVRQRQAILDELELQRRVHPDAEAFFAAHPTEPFFVKNLENVQGDERDVVFISVGYGRNPQGYMAMRFGPLSNDGGERRLNVLISRAKRRCEVFSSITADDIDLGRASGRGVAALKTFLSFAQTGHLGIATRTGRTEDSPFEEFVCDAVRNLGYEVHPQVGVAGFFIDLAVQDREKPGRYLLGIECDGAAYHSSRSARERDRLRQAVLEDHGWIIHRIWSTDWFQRPGEQLAKVAAAIERAKAVLAAAEDDARAAPVAHAVDVERDNAVVSVAEPDSLSVPYQQAEFAVPTQRAPHELSTAEMAQIARRVVELEGPVHGDEVAVRVRELWGLGRTGSRIQESVSKALSLLVRRGECSEDDGFYALPSAVIAIRNRGSASSASLRRPEYLPGAEVRAAVLLLIDTYHGAQRLQIATAVGRMLGFKATSAGLRTRIDQQVAALVASGLLEVEDDDDGGDASVRRRSGGP